MATNATVAGGFEPLNALDVLWIKRPRLAARVARRHNYAKAVQTYLRAVDFYSCENGVPPRRIRVETHVHDGRIVQRISG